MDRALITLYEVGLLSRKKESKCLNLFKDIFFSLYFFAALFQPPILSINIKYIVMGFNLTVFLWISSVKGNVKLPKKILYVFLGFLPFFVYLFFMQLAHISNDLAHKSIYISLFKSMVNVVLYFYIMILALISMINFFQLNYYKIIRYFCLASLLQLGCVLFAFFVPTVKSFFLGIILKNSDDEVIINSIMKGQSYRCFGFAGNLFDSFGYIFSVLISVILLEGLAEKNNKYVIAAISMLFIPLVNTRTGLILAFVGFVIIGAFYFNPKLIVIVILLSPVIILIVNEVMKLLPSTTSQWVLKGIDETSALVNGGKATGTYSDILGKDIVYPRDMLCGEGATPETLANYIGIDSGYIQCLWRYGILGSILLFGAYINAFALAFFSTKEKKFKCAVVVTMAIFFVYLFKLYSISNYGSAMLILGVPVIIICESYASNRKVKQL